MDEECMDEHFETIRLIYFYFPLKLHSLAALSLPHG
jgi:hypothetical protein